MINELINNYRICRGEATLIRKFVLFVRLCLVDICVWFDEHEKLVWRGFIAYLIIMTFAFLWLEWWRIAVLYRYITKGY